MAARRVEKIVPIQFINLETEELIRGMAELEQVTPFQAVHTAVSQWVSELDLSSHEAKVVEGVVKRRVLIAHMDGEDRESSRTSNELLGAAIMPVLLLIGWGMYSAVREGAILAAIVVSIISAYVFHRSLTTATKGRSKQKKEYNRQIAEVLREVPSELQFLSDGPTCMDIDLSSDETEGIS
jgi:hypothetical protein